MDDLISRQAAIDAVHYEWDLCLNFDGSGTEIANDTEKALCDVPSVDAVEVVRCKDCKSFSHGYCKFHDAKFVREDGYCYWGERKADRKEKR